jgi:hypothetical protein
MWYYAQNRSLAETDRQMTKHGMLLVIRYKDAKFTQKF